MPLNDPESFPDPETYMEAILPWIEAETGLKANLEKVPFPEILLQIGELHFNGQMAAGIYDHQDNLLYLAYTMDSFYTAATLVHELVHWLQNANGWFKEDISKPREEIEALAYKTQLAFMKNVLSVDPRNYGLTDAFIQKILEEERLRGIVIAFIRNRMLRHSSPFIRKTMVEEKRPQ